MQGDLAAVYARVSTDEQERGYSLAGQMADCRAYCDRQGYRVARIFQETGSGNDLERPAFQRLLDVACRGKVAVVVVWRRDRFARHAIGAGYFTNLLRRNGVRLEASQTGPQDDTPETRFVNHLMDGLAELERETIAARIRMGKRTAATHGNWPMRAPYGYTKDSAGRLVIREDQAAILREAYGESIRGANRVRIAALFGTHPGVAMQRLQNPLYKGQGDFGGVPFPAPPIVAPEAWDAAVAAIDGRRRNPSPHQVRGRRPTA